MNKKQKSKISLLLCLVMALNMLPQTADAGEADNRLVPEELPIPGSEEGAGIWEADGFSVGQMSDDEALIPETLMPAGEMLVPEALMPTDEISVLEVVQSIEEASDAETAQSTEETSGAETAEPIGETSDTETEQGTAKASDTEAVQTTEEASDAETPLNDKTVQNADDISQSTEAEISQQDGEAGQNTDTTLQRRKAEQPAGDTQQGTVVETEPEQIPAAEEIPVALLSSTSSDPGTEESASYTVTIPDGWEVSKNKEETITATISGFTDTQILTVKVISKNNFHFIDPSNSTHKIKYDLLADDRSVRPTEGQADSQPVTVAEFSKKSSTNQTLPTTKAVPLTIKPEEDLINYAGTYSDTLTFTVDFSDGN